MYKQADDDSSSLDEETSLTNISKRKKRSKKTSSKPNKNSRNDNEKSEISIKSPSLEPSVKNLTKKEGNFLLRICIKF